MDVYGIMPVLLGYCYEAMDERPEETTENLFDEALTAFMEPHNYCKCVPNPPLIRAGWYRKWWIYHDWCVLEILKLACLAWETYKDRFPSGDGLQPDFRANIVSRMCWRFKAPFDIAFKAYAIMEEFRDDESEYRRIREAVEKGYPEVPEEMRKL